jgi:hypothetical protein
MPNPTGNPQTLTAPRFVKGQSGNPGGEPASRKRLTSRFLNALADDFDIHGAKAIQDCREQNPAAYIKAIAALCPRDLNLSRPLEELDVAELLTALRSLEGFVAAGAIAGGDNPAQERESVN